MATAGDPATYARQAIACDEGRKSDPEWDDADTEEWELRDKSSLSEGRKDLIVDGGYVKGMSGMSCVIPAWHILDVLELPALGKPKAPVQLELPFKRRSKGASR